MTGSSGLSTISDRRLLATHLEHEKIPLIWSWPAGSEIAKALGLNYAFYCEFEELHSPMRNAQSQVSSASNTSCTHSAAASLGIQMNHTVDNSCILHEYMRHCAMYAMLLLPFEKRDLVDCKSWAFSDTGRRRSWECNSHQI